MLAAKARREETHFYLHIQSTIYLSIYFLSHFDTEPLITSQEMHNAICNTTSSNTNTTWPPTLPCASRLPHIRPIQVSPTCSAAQALGSENIFPSCPQLIIFIMPFKNLGAIWGFSALAAGSIREAELDVENFTQDPCRLAC